MHRSVILLIALVLGVGAVAVAQTAPGAPGHPITTPKIVSVTPGSASPGAGIVIKAINVPSDKSKAEVWFTLKAGTTAQGTITNTTVDSQNVITFWVQVPGDDTLTAPFRGPLYIKNKDDGRVTPNVQFNIVPISPKITSHTPQYGAPGKTTTFRGVNFKATDEVNVSGAGLLPLDFHSATEIAITLPSNYPTTTRLISVGIRRKGGSGWSMYPYALDPKFFPENKTGNTGQKVESKENPPK
jgi:hypothetical protein